MADWPPMKSVKDHKEKEKIYLTLVDMFMDVVEPAIIQIILQNRNWDLDAALEDIMILSSNPHSDKAHRSTSKSHTDLEEIKKSYIQKDIVSNTTNITLQDQNMPSNTINCTTDPRKVYQNSFSTPVKMNVKKAKPQIVSKTSHLKTPDVKKTSQLNLLPFFEQYNYVKAIPVAYDRAVMLIKDGVKLMVVLRGPPGSGKSHLAKNLLNEAGIISHLHRKHIFSSDDFFVQNNVYVFVPDLLGAAHLWNQRNVGNAVREHVSPIIVDNTNTQAWEMRVYAEMAVSAGYDLEILEPDNWWFAKENELAKRNIHGVPKAKIRNMIERYEKKIMPNKLLQQFELRYSLSNAPPQPTCNSKWKDKFSSQKNNKPKKKKGEFSPKTVSQSNLVNFNDIFQSLPINSPDFSQMPSSQSSLQFQSENSENNCVSKKHFLNSVEVAMESNNSLQQMNGEHICVGNFDHSNRPTTLFDCTTNSQVRENSFDGMKSSSVNKPKVLVGAVAKSSSAVSSSVSNQSPTPHSTSNFSENIFNQCFEHSCTQDTDDAGYEDQACQNSFDFMVESGKLLVSFGKPDFKTKEKEFHTSDKDLDVSSVISSPNLTGKVLVNKQHELVFSDVRGLKSVSEVNQDEWVLEQGGDTEDKKNDTKELLDLIIDQVVNKSEVMKTEKYCDDCELHGSFDNEDKSLWEYVVVNDDNTCIYKRLTSEPLSFDITTNKHTEFSVQNNVQGNRTSDLNYQPKDVNYDELLKEIPNECNMNSIKENKFPEPDTIEKGNELGDINLCVKSTSEQAKVDCSENCNLIFSHIDSKEITGSDVVVETCDNSVATICADSIDDSENRLNHFCNVTGDVEQEMDLKGKANSDVLGMMKDILNSVLPYCDNSPSECVSDMANNTKESETSLKIYDIESENNENVSNNISYPTSNSSGEWGSGADYSTEPNKKNVSDITQPKQARIPTRQRFLTTLVKSFQSQKQESSKNLGTWDTVSNPLEHWDLKEGEVDCFLDFPKKEAAALPQHPRLQNKKLVDSSTNTNYLDFSLINDETPTGFKILTGNRRNITTDSYRKVKPDMSGIVLLDKSTMTSGNFNNTTSNFDIHQISTLFPNIPEKYILDMIEKCQGDIDWAVDLLLDSEHRIYSFASDEPNDNLCTSKDNKEMKESFNLPVEDDKSYSESKFNPKCEHKIPNTHEQAELKKIIESSVVFGKSHYSDKVLKVLKKKHPEYLNLIENGHQFILDKNSDKEKSVQIAQHEHICQNEVEVVIEDDSDYSEESSSNSGDVENEGDSLELIVNSDLILQLQQKFGFSNLPGTMRLSPVVKLPVSLARQLYGYIMDTLQSELDAQQDAIERAIAQDEEIAKLLQYKDQNLKPQLQEIMDMELALAVHRADQEEFEEKSHKTVAAKLSKNILLEKFPHVDPKMLMDVLYAHKYSLHDTVASLTLALGVNQPQSTGLEGTWDFTDSRNQPKEVRASSSVLVPEQVSGSDSSNPVNEAHSHREQAATYYSLRMECLNKAHQAFHSGNKPVASYYSQLAQLHKDKVEHCNSRAAACLLSTHKCGTNTLDLHFLHVTEAEIVLDMFLDEVINYIIDKKRTYQRVFLITGRGLRSVGGVSRIKPMVQRKLQNRDIIYNEVNPGMICALVRNTTPFSCTL